MANTKNTTTKKTKPKAETAPKTVETAEVTQAPEFFMVPEVPEVKDVPKYTEADMLRLLQQLTSLNAKKGFEPTDEVEVQSNFAGTLTYTSRRTSERWKWSKLGDTNFMPLEELQTMRNTQRDFFTNNWIKIIGDEADDIMKNLRINQYYTNFVDLTNLPELFEKKVDDIVKQVKSIPQEAKNTLAIAAKSMIAAGELRDIIVIRALSDAIGYDLLQN